jgi:hypothetical protein
MLSRRLVLVFLTAGCMPMEGWRYAIAAAPAPRGIEVGCLVSTLRQVPATDSLDIHLAPDLAPRTGDRAWRAELFRAGHVLPIEIREQLDSLGVFQLRFRIPEFRAWGKVDKEVADLLGATVAALFQLCYSDVPSPAIRVTRT